MYFRQIIAGLALGAVLSAPLPAKAQGADSENAPESDIPESAAVADEATPTEIPEELFHNPVIDEVTVTVGPDGRTPYEIEMDRLAQYREEIYAEMRLRERYEEESAWRQADRDLDNPSSRIKWGYSPQAEQRMRRENDFMYDLPIDQTKPATLFRAEF